MMTTLTPPSSEPSAAPTVRRSSAAATTFLVAGIALAAAGVTTAVSATAQVTADTALVLTASVDDVRELSIDAGWSNVTVQFGDVAEATLDVRNSSASGVREWQLETSNETLRVSQPQSWWPNLALGSFDTDDAVLTLPDSLRGQLDLDVSTGAGDTVVMGDFADTTMEVGAGALEYIGAATNLDVSVGTGDVTLDAVDVGAVKINVGVGAVRGDLSGTAPAQTSLDVAAGDIVLTMPDVAYRVTQDVAVGDATIGVATSGSASNSLIVTVAVGSVSVMPAQP